MIARYSAVVIAALLAGCTTPYRPPAHDAPPPAMWSGAAGLRPVAGTLETFEGRFEEGGVLARYALVPARTGRLAEDALFGNNVIPAGTPVFAAQYTLSGGLGYSNVFNNPIEWCAVRPGERTGCFFWEAPERARYLVAQSGPTLSPQPALAGEVGAVPVIVEERVTFDQTLFAEVRVADLTRQGVEIGLQRVELDADGRLAAETDEDSGRTVTWDEARRAELEMLDGVVLLQGEGDRGRGAPDAVTAMIAEPLQDPGHPRITAVDAERLCTRLGAEMTENFSQGGWGMPQSLSIGGLITCHFQDGGSTMATPAPGAPEFALTDADVLNPGLAETLELPSTESGWIAVE